MLLRPLYPCCLLLGLGLLGACGHPPKTTPAAARPDPFDSLADALRRPDEPAEAVDTMLFGLTARPLPVIDTLGPVALRREIQECYYQRELTPELRGLFYSDILPRLFYRVHPRDTSWLELDPAFVGGLGQQDIYVEQANLDGHGRPEVLLRFSSGEYGSGGGTRYESCYLLDLTPPRPRLLVRAVTAEVDEASQAYAKRHGDTIPADQVNIGYERAIHLCGREVRIAEADTLGRWRAGENFRRFPPTPLRAGRYCYQGGQLRRLGR